MADFIKGLLKLLLLLLLLLIAPVIYLFDWLQVFWATLKHSPESHGLHTILSIARWIDKNLLTPAISPLMRILNLNEHSPFALPLKLTFLLLFLYVLHTLLIHLGRTTTSLKK